MPKPVAETGNKNLIGSNLIALRKKHHLSQRALAHELPKMSSFFATFFQKKFLTLFTCYSLFIMT